MSVTAEGPREKAPLLCLVLPEEAPVSSLLPKLQSKVRTQTHGQQPLSEQRQQAVGRGSVAGRLSPAPGAGVGGRWGGKLPSQLLVAWRPDPAGPSSRTNKGNLLPLLHGGLRVSPQSASGLCWARPGPQGLPDGLPSHPLPLTPSPEPGGLSESPT